MNHKPFISPEQAQVDVPSTFELSSSVPPPPPFSETLDTQSFQDTVQPKMPDTRRSLKGGTGPAASTGATDETDNPVRKSLRGMRNDAALKRTEAKVKAQKLAEERKKNGTESKVQRRSTSVPGSETTGSSAATLARGQARKFQILAQNANGNSNLMIPSDMHKAEETSAKATNGEDGASPAELEAEIGPQLTKMEFIVPLPLTGQAADQYRRTVVYQKKLIEEFTKTTSPSPEMVAEATEFIEKMRGICMHIDLINESTQSQGEVTPSQQASWDRSCSSKFKFLDQLFKLIHDHDVHIILFAKPGRLMDMLETFILGSEINYYRPDKQRKSPDADDKLGLIVTLLPSEGDGSKAVVDRANLMISLDIGMDVNNAHIRALRRNAESLTPVITLAVINSIDHIDRCMSSTWNGVERLLAEVACIAKLRPVAGKMDAEYQTIDDSASLITDFVVQGGAQGDWLIPEIGPLDDNEAWDIALGHFLPAHTDNGLGQKRSRDSSMESDGPTNKKVRVNSQLVGDASVTRISDSIPSQAEKMQSTSEDNAALRATIKAAEDRAQATIRERDISARDRETHLRELERAFDKQMNRFEDQNFLIRDLQKELEEANLTLLENQTHRQRRDETIATLKEENNTLKAQLTEARLALEQSVIPEVAELERLRREKEEAVNARMKAESEMTRTNNLGEYLKTEYTTASSHAMELAAENEDLHIQVASLSKKANGEAVRLKQINLDTQAKMAMQEVDKLKLDLKNVNQILSRKEEELKTKRSGVGTRGGSVPRSPRVGPSSRGGSPIPDRRVEAVKNNSLSLYVDTSFNDLNTNNLCSSGRKSKNIPVPSEDSTPRTTIQNAHTPTRKEPKHVESNQAELKPMESRFSDIQPAQLKPPPPMIEAKSPLAHTRPFPCCFAQFNCHASFTSKNEWKRHISTKHIQLGFWRCDMCNPSPVWTILSLMTLIGKICSLSIYEGCILGPSQAHRVVLQDLLAHHRPRMATQRKPEIRLKLVVQVSLAVPPSLVTRRSPAPLLRPLFFLMKRLRRFKSDAIAYFALRRSNPAVCSVLVLSQVQTAGRNVLSTLVVISSATERTQSVVWTYRLGVRMKT